MLLVDDREPEAAEVHPLLDEGVGADRERDPTRREPGQCLAPRPALHGAGEQRHVHAERLGERPHRFEVLLGEQLGRRHERDLVARLDHGERREQRHQRLAAADVALEKPPHRMGCGEIGLDLRECPILRSRRAKRQPRVERWHETRGPRERAPLLLSGGAPPERQAELEEEELVEDQRAVCDGARGAERLEVRLRRGGMHVAERARQVDQAMACCDVRRQCARHAIGELVDGRMDDPAHRAHVHLGRLLVDRQDAGDDGLVGGQRLDLRMDHAERRTAERRLDLAVDHEPLAGGQPATEVRDLMEPDE